MPGEHKCRLQVHFLSFEGERVRMDQLLPVHSFVAETAQAEDKQRQ